ncbi:MAG: hypothetical protein ACRDJ9_30160 [Dehalococcoidia bacterium]
MFEAVFRGGARISYECLDVFDRAEIDHIIRLIELNPYLDGVHKIEIVIAPLVLQAYDNGTWQITYRIVEPFIEIYGVKRAERQ